MTDDRLRRAFREVDGPVEPDARFADGLFEALAGDLGLADAGRSSTLRTRFRRIAFGRQPRGATAFRLAYVAALLGLLLAVLAGSLYVASQLRPRPSPLELVRLSQAALADPPAVGFTVRSEFGEADVVADGRGTWRSTGLGVSAGSYALYDGDRVGTYDATTRAWRVAPLADSSPPFPFDGVFAWISLSFPDSKATLTPVDCSSPTDIGEAVIAGRVADGVGCPAVGMRYWLDRSTHLVLRASADAASPYWTGRADGAPTVTEVTAFETVDAPDEALFAWQGPTQTAREAGPVAGTKLIVGEAPPAWSGTTIGGEPYAVPSPGAPAAILLSAGWCPPCMPAYDGFNAAAARHPDVALAVIGIGELPGTLTGFVAQHPAAVPVIPDGDGDLAKDWGIESIPLLVLLDARGAVADVVVGGLAATDFDRVLTALAAGGPIPAVQPAPPSPSISPGQEPPANEASPGIVCTEELVTCLPKGGRPGAWSGPTPGGGTITSADLAGRPAVLWFESPSLCEGPCPDWVGEAIDGYQSLEERYGDRATILLVTGIEKAPGDTERQLREAGATFPVVFDWDGSITSAYDLAVMGVLVLDTEGRIVEALGGPYHQHAEEAEAALARLLDP